MEAPWARHRHAMDTHVSTMKTPCECHAHIMNTPRRTMKAPWAQTPWGGHGNTMVHRTYHGDSMETLRPNHGAPGPSSRCHGYGIGAPGTRHGTCTRHGGTMVAPSRHHGDTMVHRVRHGNVMGGPRPHHSQTMVHRIHRGDADETPWPHHEHIMVTTEMQWGHHGHTMNTPDPPWVRHGDDDHTMLPRARRTNVASGPKNQCFLGPEEPWCGQGAFLVCPCRLYGGTGAP